MTLQEWLYIPLELCCTTGKGGGDWLVASVATEVAGWNVSGVVGEQYNTQTVKQQLFYWHGMSSSMWEIWH